MVTSENAAPEILPEAAHCSALPPSANPRLRVSTVADARGRCRCLIDGKLAILDLGAAESGINHNKIGAADEKAHADASFHVRGLPNL